MIIMLGFQLMSPAPHCARCVGIDTKHKTPFKIDAFNMDKLVSLGSKYSSDFKDDEEYKSLAKGIEEKKEKN